MPTLFENEFALIREAGGKKMHFVQIKHVDDETGVVTVIHPATDHWDSQSQRAFHLMDKDGQPTSRVVAVFGDNFERGVAYGVKMYNVLGKKAIPFGTVFFCCSPGGKERVENILKSFNEANDILVKHGVEDIAAGDVIYEVHNAISLSGSWQVKVAKGSAKKPSFMYLHADAISDGQTDDGVSHFAHALLYGVSSLIYKKFFVKSTKLKSEWISEFSLMTKRTMILDDTTDELFNDLSSRKYSSIKDMASTLMAKMSEDQAEIASDGEVSDSNSPRKSQVLNLILDYIKRHYGLKVDELEVLYAYDRFDLLRRMWPFGKIRYTARTDSAMKSLLFCKDVEEFFASALADYMSGAKDLPANLAKLCKQSLDRAAVDTPDGV